MSDDVQGDEVVGVWISPGRDTVLIQMSEAGPVYRLDAQEGVLHEHTLSSVPAAGSPWIQLPLPARPATMR